MGRHGERSLIKSETAGVAVIYAICITVLMMMVTLLYDMSALVTSKRNMQLAADASALAGARLLNVSDLSDDEIESSVAASFAQNMVIAHEDMSCDDAVAEFDRETGDMKVTAICWYKPMLAGTVAPQQIKIERITQANIANSKLDVAMVLDLSGSMNSSGKLSALKSASKLAAATILSVGETGDARVSFVGYSEAVNILEYYDYATGWSETVEPAPEGVTVIDCVSERVGDAAFTDAPPGSGAYFPDGGTTCPIGGLLPLSSNLATFEDAIDGLKASGSTAGHLGVAWGWYLLSPLWTGVWPEDSTPRAYDDDDAVKVVILMTDGAFNNATHDDYGTSSQQAVRLCEKMREKDIIIFSVAFSAPPAGQTTLKNCAGTEDRYYEASSNEDLIAAFDEIANLLAVLRIVA